MKKILSRFSRFFNGGFRYVLRIPRKIAWAYITKKRTNQPIITRLGKQLKVRIYPKDTLGASIFIYGFFEKSECLFVKRFLQQGMTFFDVGTNFGQYTLLAADRVGKTGQVHSFEPSNRLFDELKYNVATNGLESICSLNRVAISDTIGTAQLSKYEEGAEVFGSLGTHQRKEACVIGTETVETITLDSYVKNNCIQHIDFMKMDIEGAELLALQGARELLSRPDAPAIVIELSDVNCAGFSYQAIEIWDYLEQLGYTMYEVIRNGSLISAKKPTGAISSNYVAMKGKMLQNEHLVA